MDIFFRISYWDISLAIFSFLFFSYVLIRNVRASNFKKSIIFIETLRFVIVAFVIATLFEPEYIKKEKRTNKPEIVVLYDKTASMKTVDVVKGDKLISREKSLQTILSNNIFKKLEENFLVNYESFTGNEKKDFSDISEALKVTRLKYQNLQNIILISDGDWNKGNDPTQEALYYGTQNISIHTLTLGKSAYLKDIVLVDINAPAFTLAKEATFINFEVSNHFDYDINTKVVLRNDSEIIQEKTIFIAAQESLKDKFIWKPTNAGNYKFIIETPILKNEDIKNNNKKELSIMVREELLSVLVIDGSPRWEYRYLRNALYRDSKVKVSTYLFHDKGMKPAGGKGYLKKLPSTIQEWAKYDVVFLGDIGINTAKGISEQQAELVKGLVSKQGSGLVFLPGSYGRQYDFINSPLEELLPVNFDENKKGGVVYDSISKIHLTLLGDSHLLTLLNNRNESNDNLWKKLPGFYWSNALKSAKKGTQTLAVHSKYKMGNGQPMPLLVISQYGNGNVLYMGIDNAWKWRKGVEDKYHYRFWGQVVRWMAHKRHIVGSDNGRIAFYPEKPLVGESVKIEATLFDLSHTPIANGDVTVSIRDNENSQQIFPLKELKGNWGVYEGLFRPEKGGTYIIQIKENKSQKIIETKFEVLNDILEKLGQPANARVMQEIALLSEGQIIDADKLDKIIYDLNEIAKKFNEFRIKIWSLKWWIGLLFGLFTLYWILRKKLGFI